MKTKKKKYIVLFQKKKHLESTEVCGGGGVKTKIKSQIF